MPRKYCAYCGVTCVVARWGLVGWRWQACMWVSGSELWPTAAPAWMCSLYLWAQFSSIFVPPGWKMSECHDGIFSPQMWLGQSGVGQTWKNQAHCPAAAAFSRHAHPKRTWTFTWERREFSWESQWKSDHNRLCNAMFDQECVLSPSRHAKTHCDVTTEMTGS